MSCPNWRELCARREEDAADAPGWHSAMIHLDDCPACQKEALDADPTLLFRRLPELEVDAEEVRAMQRAVAGMRRSEPLARRTRSVSSIWLRAAALGAVLLGSILLRGAGVPAERNLLAGSPVAEASFSEATSYSEAAVAADEAENRTVRDLPLVEMVDPAYGPLIEVVDQDISLVVVMPEIRDV